MNNKKIVCPVDFSKGSEHAVQKARELAAAMKASVELIHVYALPVLALPDAAVSVSPTYVAELTDRAQQALNRHRDELASAGIETTTRLLEGNPAPTIVEHAKQAHATMIVMGTHGRSGFERLLLGSTAERVVRMSTVPVLTVHLPAE